MAPPADQGLPFPQVLARLLRHEVGDLLQVIYSFVAILNDRLPEGGVERRLLAELKGRAETCRQELDAAVDLVCPLGVQPTALDLTALTRSILPPITRRFPQRQVELDAPQPVSVLADPQRLAGALALMTVAACQEAARHVLVRVQRRDGRARWSVRRDGPPPTADQLAWLERPFATTHHALFGLGVALARRVGELHGGTLEAESFPAGGIEVRLDLPAEEAPGP